MTVKNGKRPRNKSARELISLKKPSALEKIIETVPKPKGAVPNFGLPRWRLMPLESKIPMIPGPAGAYNFTRRKMGKKLWIQTKNAEFNLNDPCNYEMEFSYDSLHDEHLARFFSRESNIKRMLKLGFVTENLDAKCTLKDYNMYRKFLKKLHNDSINQELKRRSNLADEKRVIEFADFAAQRDIERLKIAERKTLARNKATQELKKREERKKQERRNTAEELKERKASIELAKKEALRRRSLISKAQAEYARQKRAAAVEIKKRQIIKTLIAWARKESKRKKARKERLAREAEEKRRIVEEKWNRRKQQEEKEIITKKLTLLYAEQQRQNFIKNYNKKIDKQRALLQRRFMKIRRFVGCYMARGGSKCRRRRSCCKKSREKKIKEGNVETIMSIPKPHSTQMLKKHTMQSIQSVH